MKAACEICGSPLRASPNRVEVDGAIMVVCNNCARLGKPVAGPVVPRGRPEPHAVHQAAFRTLTQRPSQPPIEPEYDVDPDYNLLIKQAREKLGLSQEQLGKMLNEKPSLIRMVEARKLKPDIGLTRKLMHELKINLLVPISELEGAAPSKSFKA